MRPRFLPLALALAAALAAASARGAESVGVRAGAHDGFGRMVFDWTAPVKYEAKADGGRLVVSFARPFQADYAEVARHLGDYVGPPAPAADGRSVGFPLLRPVEVRAALIDGKVAVDLRDAKPAKPAKPSESVGLRVGAHDGYSRLVFDWRRDTPYAVDAKDGRATVTFSRPAAIDGAAVERRRPAHVEGFAARVEGDKTIVELTLAPGARLRHFRDGPRVAIDVLAPAKQPEPAKPQAKAEAKPEAKTEPEKAEPAKAETTAPKPQPAKEAKAAASPPDPKAPRIGVAPDGRSLRLDFAWPQPTPAAIFTRAGRLWLVFGARAELDLRALKAADGVLEAEQLRHPNVTALRLQLREGLAPAARRDGGVWTVRLGPQTAPASAVTATPEPAAAPKPRVFISANEPGAPVELADPEVGDRLIVVPTLAGGQGAPGARDFVTFGLLPSAQGVALRPRVEGLQVIALKDGVAVSAPGGMALSAPSPVAAQAAALSTGKPTAAAAQPRLSTTLSAAPAESSRHAALEPPLMDLPAWSRAGRNFVEERQTLQRDAATAPKAKRNAARFELAKFLFANDLATEALAQLSMILKTDPNVAREPIFRAVRGAALLLAGRPAEAAEELAHAELDRYGDVALWRGAALAAEGRLEEANRQFGAAFESLAGLPESLRERLLLAWAKAAVEATDLQGADAALGLARELPQTPALTAQIALLSGRAAELRREPDVALEEYEAAAASAYRPVRGPAALARTELRLKRKLITPQGALEALEKLHFAWRGDSFEVTLMQHLAELRFMTEDYLGGLDVLRQAVTYFPKSPLAKPLGQRMAQVFGELFQDGKADALSPVNALALYYEFKELTPAGAPGDAMIQKLADRLVGVDLLDQASKLLDHQVSYRLKGEEQARVGARLAVIQLLDKQPQKALASLEKTKNAQLPPPLEAERRQLAARAYADLGQGAETLRLLEGDSSTAADLLRADLHWREQKWPEAARALRSLLASHESDEQALGELEQAQVVKLAVALYMGNDAAGVDALRQRFGARMAEGKHAESFKLLTSEIDPSKIEFRKLAGAIARVDELEAFMANYRTKLAQKTLSAIN